MEKQVKPKRRGHRGIPGRLHRAVPRIQLYKRGIINLLDLLVMALAVWATAVGLRKGGLIGILPCAFGFFYLVYWLLSPQSIHLFGDRIQAEHLFFRRSIKASRIKIIKVNPRFHISGLRLHDFIYVRSASGHTISMEYLPGSTPDLYKLLQGWLREYRSNTKLKGRAAGQ